MENSPLCERPAMFLQQTALEVLTIVLRAPHRGRRAAPGPGLRGAGAGPALAVTPALNPHRSAAGLRGGIAVTKLSCEVRGGAGEALSGAVGQSHRARKLKNKN